MSIILTLKQAIYHTIRARAVHGSEGKTSVRVEEWSGGFECIVENPEVTPQDCEKKAKDAEQLKELAKRLSRIHDATWEYRISGPRFSKNLSRWVTIIHAETAASKVSQ